jgi:Domain of unknown function (DUF4416)
MAEPCVPDPVLLVVAVFSRHPPLRSRARVRLEQCFGPVGGVSRSYTFNQTAYYEATMGPGLEKELLFFHNLFAPDCLPEVKRRTNELEQELGQESPGPEPRPINLDPGMLTLGKFHLATTKDQAHRIYLGQGIFGEVTLRFQDGAFVPCPWTYADYRQALVLDFLKEARNFYRRRLVDEKSRHPGYGAENENA